jgi:hypothetical protein
LPAAVLAGSDTPLHFHEQVDRLVEAPLGGKLAAPATDSELCRRIWLDLIGRIPTAADARAYIDDPSPYKRVKLVDRLMQMPEFDRRLAVVFDLWLMERRPDQHVPRREWLEYLRRSFAANKPYDQLVREILEADGIDPARRPAAKFYLDRGGEPNTITRDVGRVFLGRDLACAQCHDHVYFDDYKQAHYQGLLAFFGRSYLVVDRPSGPSLGEKAEGEVAYRSVFKKKVEHKTGPRLLDTAELPDVPIAKGAEYVVAPSDKTHAIPSASRRAKLAPLLTSGSIPEFDRAITNRVWSLVMGRGLVHPFDFHHAENPPSHPELLHLLATEFRARKCDIKWLLRELVLTRTYARASEPPSDWSESDAAPERFSCAPLRPLTPEQIGWSVMQATGVVQNYYANAESSLFGSDSKLRDLVSLDRPRGRLKIELIEERVDSQLSQSVQEFVTHYGRPPGQSQDSADTTVQQALFLANGGTIRSWLAPSGQLVGKLQALSDTGMLADELYLAVLTRRPTAEEQAEAKSYLESHKDKRVEAIQDLAWSLLSSTEFRFNH